MSLSPRVSRGKNDILEMAGFLKNLMVGKSSALSIYPTLFFIFFHSVLRIDRLDIGLTFALTLFFHKFSHENCTIIIIICLNSSTFFTKTVILLRKNNWYHTKHACGWCFYKRQSNCIFTLLLGFRLRVKRIFAVIQIAVYTRRLPQISALKSWSIFKI